jgi:hypothetical protein
MNFGQALEALQAGLAVKRSIWKGYWFMSTIMGSPLIVAKVRDNGGFAGAQPYQADMLATDWELVPDPYEMFTRNEPFQVMEEAVYPSEKKTIGFYTDDTYGGAHRYFFQKSAGFENGETKYVADMAEICFVQKDLDGTIKPGLLSEQVVLALINRHKKLNEAFPSPHNEKGIAGLQQFLDAQQERVDERLNRGVMGELKK